MPVHISGVPGAGTAGGRFDLSKRKCAGTGRWQAMRNF
jgi:hypothetical protein